MSAQEDAFTLKERQGGGGIRTGVEKFWPLEEVLRLREEAKKMFDLQEEHVRRSCLFVLNAKELGMSGKSASHGKAFENAFMQVMMNEIIAAGGHAELVENNATHTAKKFYDEHDPSIQEDYKNRAQFGVDLILGREVHILEYGAKNHLYLQSDDKARDSADVRDLIIESSGKSGDKVVGVSLKINNDAARHSRLSPTIDFGYKWYGVPVSIEYKKETGPIFDLLRKNKGVKWEESSLDKENSIYIPLLKAFQSEIMRAYDRHGEEIISKLLKHVIGAQDFYKFISMKNKYIMERYVLDGEVPNSVKMPTRLIDFNFKKDKSGKVSENTLIMVLDNDWVLSFRIHNASSKVEVSMKFDVRIIGKPAGITIEGKQ